jgi:hypothetical protein
MNGKSRTWCAGIKCCDSGPFSGSLLACLIEDLGDHRLAVGVLEFEDVECDLDQKGVEDALVPFLEDGRDFILMKTQAALENVVALGNQLHVTILDT